MPQIREGAQYLPWRRRGTSSTCPQPHTSGLQLFWPSCPWCRMGATRCQSPQQPPLRDSACKGADIPTFTCCSNTWHWQPRCPATPARHRKHLTAQSTWCWATEPLKRSKTLQICLQTQTHVVGNYLQVAGAEDRDRTPSNDQHIKTELISYQSNQRRAIGEKNISKHLSHTTPFVPGLPIFLPLPPHHHNRERTFNPHY